MCSKELSHYPHSILISHWRADRHPWDISNYLAWIQPSEAEAAVLHLLIPSTLQLSHTIEERSFSGFRQAPGGKRVHLGLERLGIHVSPNTTAGCPQPRAQSSAQHLSAPWKRSRSSTWAANIASSPSFPLPGPYHSHHTLLKYRLKVCDSIFS